MKTMHWLGVIATSLISASTLAGCSGDDPQPVGTAGTGSGVGGTAAGGTGGTAGAGTGGGGTAGTGTAGTGTAGTGTAGTGSSNVGTQLNPPESFTILTATEAPAGAPAPAGYTGAAFCNACHGESAQGTEIAPEIRFTPTDFLKGVVRAGRKNTEGKDTGMVAFTTTQISDTDLDGVAAWLLSLPKPTDGPGLYHAMCGNCHGPKMPTGGGSPITIQGASIANVDKYVRNGNGTDVNDRKTYMPKYDLTLLTEAELSLIKTFIGAK